IGRGEADAIAEADGGGAIQVGVANAEAAINPTVDASVGTLSTLAAAGNVKVTAELKKTPSTPPPSDLIQDGGDADTLVVDIGNDTVDFNFPLRDGDSVVYDAPSPAAAIGGLLDGREYNIINAGAGKIQFGNLFEAASTAIDGLTDTLVFAQPHRFVAGDAVRYDARGGLSIVAAWQTTLGAGDPMYVNPGDLLYVRTIPLNPADPSSGVDPFRIKLARTAALATAAESTLMKGFDAALIDAATDTLTLTAHGFADGQSVTYRADAVLRFFTESVDVSVVDRTVNVNGTNETFKDITRDAAGIGQHVDNDNIFLANHGLAAGAALTYRNTGSEPDIVGLSNGTTYYVIYVDANQIKLATTYFNAVGRASEGSAAGDLAAVAAGQAIELGAAGQQGGTHQFEKAVKGLRDGVTYYVNRVDANSFQLMTSRADAISNTSPVQIDIRDTFALTQNNGAPRNVTVVTREGTHHLGTTGIDLVSGTGTQALLLPLTSEPGAGEHRLLGSGGVALA
ncbi:MAG TPA: hypothetical protein VIP10_02125, partial [Burkholderiaceae bacterium]